MPRRIYAHRLFDVDPDELAGLVAHRLQRIVPPGFHVDFSDGMLWYTSDEGRFPGQTNSYQAGSSGTYFRDNFSGHGGTVEERIVGVCRQALDELQDYVDEASHDPWPGEIRPPEAQAEIRGSSLHLWYSYAGVVFGECEAIPLDLH